ncbi:hypothetical protein [Carnobacterium alterfunditum]|uniref:hypothetical protein n=1 Tax=Carnobacterium alterfunditum TaxID=28230 RepID=UPI00359367E1
MKITENRWDSAKSFFKTYDNFLLLLLFILISLVEFSIIIYTNAEWARDILKKIFLNADGSFNLTTITAVIAIITLIVNTYLTSRKYKADLISTSRISWLNTVRNLSAEIISSSSNIATLVNTLVSNYKDIEKIKSGEKNFNYDSKEQGLKKIDIHNENLALGINKNRSILLEKTNLFKLYFGDNTENNKVVNESEGIMELSNDLIRLYLSFSDGSPAIKASELLVEVEEKLDIGETLLDQFSNSCRNYYKEVWDKAKAGK